MAALKMKIEFGLMNLACRREGAVEEGVKLKNLCIGPEKNAHDPSPLKQDPSYCPVCGPVSEAGRVVRGHGSKDTWTVLSTEQVEALNDQKQEFAERESLKLVAHPAAEFLTATAPGAGVYYVTPEPTEADRYALLVRLIERHPELTFAGLLSISKGGKAKLWSLTVREGVLVLTERVREQALKPAPVVAGEPNEKLLAMVEGALDAFTTPYSAEDYEDRYEAAVREAVASGEAVTSEGATSVASTDEELMSKLAALGGEKKAKARKKAS